LVEDLKHNLLSVSKICDQGYTLTFDSRKCKIRENNSGRLVATATRRPNNIYILDMKKREKTEATQNDSKEEKVPKTKNKDEVLFVGRLVVVIDVNPSHGFWTARLMKVFGHEGQCTCRYNTHGWIVYIMLFPMVCGTSRGSSWLRRNEFLKMTK
jgi:hypothetical protein